MNMGILKSGCVKMKIWYNFTNRGVNIMDIIRDIEDKYLHLFSSTALALHNAFMIIEDNNVYTYEFEIRDFKASVIANTDKYIEEVIEEFHFFNAIIFEFERNGRLIKSYEPKQIIRLPISILQPSQLYICEEKLKRINDYMLEEEIFIPVALIDDEYVVLDGHTRLYSLYDNAARMANCYFDEYSEYIKDFVYFAKEQGIVSVNKMNVIPKDKYKVLWHGFCDAYFAVKR